MSKYLVVSVWLLAGTLAGANPWRPSERFLSAVRYVESANGMFLFGDSGQSLGDFQISEAAWADVSSWRKERNLPCYNYNRCAFNSRINRAYAADYLSLLQGELKKKLNRNPSSSEIYAAYNMGIAQFAQCKYSLNQVNPVTLRKCQQINLILQGRFTPDFNSSPRLASR